MSLCIRRNGSDFLQGREGKTVQWCLAIDKFHIEIVKYSYF